MMLALLLAVTPVSVPVPETYTVQSGDTCASIAQKIFGTASDYAKLHTYNDLGALPHRLHAGQVLRLTPPSGAPQKPEESPDAHLTFLRPQVSTRHLLEWSPAILHMGLWRMDEVTTLRGAGAELTFRDSSTLVLEESALVVVYGDEPGAPGQKSGVSLIDGELKLALASLRTRAFEVVTPSTKVKGKGLEAVVETDAERTARLSVFEGGAEVSGKGRAVKVARDQGTRVFFGKPPEAPRPLPGAPVLEGPGALALTFGAELSARWAPSARAVRYRAQLARDPKFLDRVGDVKTTAKEVSFGLQPVGRYFVRVIAYDELGLQSRPSSSHRADVVRITGSLDEFGSLRLASGEALVVDAPEGVVVQVDGAPKPASLPAGRHVLELLDDGQTVSRTPVSVSPRPPVTTLERAGATRSLRVTFDEPIPDEGLESQPALPFTRADARTFVAPVTGDGSYTLSWQGQPLSRIEVASQPAAPAPAVLSTQVVPIAPVRELEPTVVGFAPVLPGEGTPFLAATALEPGPASARVDLQMNSGGGGLRAEARGAVGPAALSLAVRSPEWPDGARNDTLLGGRVDVHVLSEARLQVAVGADLARTWKTATSASAFVSASGGAGRWRWSTAQALAVRANDGHTGVAWSGSFQGFFVVAPTVALTAQVDPWLGEARSLSFGAGARIAPFSHFELGFSVYQRLATHPEAGGAVSFFFR